MTTDPKPIDLKSEETKRPDVKELPDVYAEEPMEDVGFWASLEALLKRPGRVLFALRNGASFGVAGSLALIAVVCLAVYGVVAGSLSGGVQLWAAPVKIVLGTAVASLICLPSLYVFLCLGGFDARVKEVFGALIAMVSLSAVMLIGLAPVAWVFSQSTDSVALMAVMHLVFWGVAVGLGARLLSRFLGRRGGSARLKGWLAIYLLVCVQMMTSLRPIVGTADTLLPTEKRFFIQHFFEVLDGEGERVVSSE
ncbi:hypothetical protein VDG1235_1120 [Verrucomicrobiia bacterium DG1235]|nr:hypothetical protein VDG1235_1120 [Verrucomicrobiae bacterium DG1235]